MEIFGFHLMPWPYLQHRSQYPDSNALYDPQLGHRLYGEYFDQIEAFEIHGFDGVCFNEHHSIPYGGMPSPNLIAASVAQRTQRIKIAIVGNLPALHPHPLRLAEEIAMLDVISGGRIISGFVRGIPTEFYAYGVKREEAAGRIDEAIGLLIKAWTEREPFSWHGSYYHYDHVSIWPRPFQQPHPPMIMPAQSPDSQAIAVRHRIGSGVAYRSLEQSKHLAESFWTLAHQDGWEPEPQQFCVLRHIYVAESEVQARAEAKPHLDYFWQKLLSANLGVLRLEGGQVPVSDQVTAQGYERPFWEYDYDSANADGLSICGDPTYVTKQILHQCRVLGCGRFMGLFQFGSMPHDMAMQNIERFARHVLPELRKAAPRSADSL